MKKIIIEFEDSVYQELFDEWKKLQNSNLAGMKCSTFESFISSILKSFITSNKLTENLKNGNFASLLDQLKDLVPSGDLSSLFDLEKSKNNVSKEKTNISGNDKNNEKYKS